MPCKATRSCACTFKTATIENGFVFLPEAAPWLADYLAELTTFPAGRHDDQVELDGAGAGLGEAEADGAGGVDRILGAAVGGRSEGELAGDGRG